MSEIYHYLQQLADSLTVGSIYMLIAIGYTMVRGIIDMINFAYGEVYMIGSYIAFIVITLLAMTGSDSVPLMTLAAFATSIIVTSAFGYSIERVAYRPLRGGNRLIPLISAIGMSIFLQNTVMLSQGSKEKAVPALLPGNFVFDESSMNGMVISYIQILIFVTTFLVMFGLTLFISRSRLGRACRTCAEDLKVTNLLGINSSNIIVLAFVIDAALAVVAVVLLGMQYSVISPGIGLPAGIKALTATMLGDIGSIPGAILGGLLLDVTEAFDADMFGNQYGDVVIFGPPILVLLFRPTGILGRPEVEEVRASPSSARCSTPSS